MPENEKTNTAPEQSATAVWREIVTRYQAPSPTRATWQLLNTLVPYAAIWYLMYLTLSVSYWLTVPLIILAGLFVIRVFIIFHDCSHRSYLKSPLANDIIGFFTGVLTLTPYYHWRWEHSIHHANAGHLDHRGVGDIWTMTVEEYLNASRWKRFAYRLARNPFVLFGIAPLYLFFIHQRCPQRDAKPREKWSVYWMNIAILGMVVGLSSIFGFWTYLVLQVGVTLVAGAGGIWLFYVQHQFEDVYWERKDEWDFTAAALQGSSYYKLPKVLQWFSGNIGFHHIHHLSPRIPNYNLERCHHAHPLFQQVKPLTLLSSLKCLTYRLWDEQRRRLVGYPRRRRAKNEQAACS